MLEATTRASARAIAATSAAYEAPSSTVRAMVRDHHERHNRSQVRAWNRTPTDEEIETIGLGQIAVRNFEETDAEYADWLMELHCGLRRIRDRGATPRPMRRA